MNLAITGMSAHWGGRADLESLLASLYFGNPEKQPPERITSETLIDSVLRDAGYDPDGEYSHRVAAIVVSPGSEIGLPSDIEQIIHRWGLTGPVEVVEEAAGLPEAAVRHAEDLLAAGSVEAVLLLDGIAGLLVKPAALAAGNGDRTYGIISRSGTNQQPGDNRLFLVSGAWEFAGRSFLQPINHVYAQTREYPTTALGSALTSQTGFSPLLPLAQAALCAYHRFLPPGVSWPSGDQNLQGTGCYLPESSRHWFLEPGQHERTVTIFHVRQRHATGTLHVTRQEDNRSRHCSLAANAPGLLLPLWAGTPDELLRRVERLREQLTSGTDPRLLASQHMREQASVADSGLTLALVADEPVGLLREAEAACRSLPGAVERRAEWQTPGGSYFTPSPLGEDTSIAFVYPGAFNSFIGLGKDIFQLFPTTYPRFSELAHAGSVLREKSLYPRLQTPPNQAEIDALETRLADDPVAMLTTGTSIAVLHTLILREVFGIRPQAAFGYSLGETSMLFALEAWSSGDEGNRALSVSPLFHTRLSGPKDAVREYWERTDPGSDKPNGGRWTNLLLMAPVERVQAELATEPRAFLTHINTPRQVVIAGDPEACQRIASQLGCPALKAPFDQVLHCPPVLSETGEIARLHTFPTRPVECMALFSAAGYKPVGFDSAGLANGIAEALSTCLDYPRLVEQVYADGARIFLEVGAGSNCSRWIDEILKGRPHLSVSTSRKGASDLSGLLRLLARLASHRISINYDCLIPSK